MGYITKNSPKEEITEAILTVVDGKRYICKRIKNSHAMQPLPIGAPPTIELLTATQLEVAKLVRQGLSSREIAGQLGCTQKTVEVHRYNILKKLNLKNGTSLVNWLSKQLV
ncbi:MAG: response regulator transcription factor [Chitinophagaceae bacterium]